MWTSQFASNMNFPTPIAVLGFLAGCGILFLSTLAFLVAVCIRQHRIATLIAKLVALAAIVYFGLLLGFSVGSREKTLVQGQEKYFCEIDCHLAYSVVAVKRDREADAMRYSVKLKTRFDETTISRRRPKDAPLTPNSREIFLVDSLGNRYRPSSATGTALNTPLIPGASYTTDLVFELPKQAPDVRLLVSSRAWEEHLLIGDEESPLHKKTWFQL